MPPGSIVLFDTRTLRKSDKRMVKLVILFKNTSKNAQFEQGYTRNLDLLRKMPGMQRIEESEVLGSPTGEPAYHLILEVSFETFDDLDAALTSPEGVAAGKDLMSFTEAQVDVLFVAEGNAPKLKVLKPENLQAFLDNHNIDAEIVFPGQPTPTVPKAAEAVGVEPDQIVKSVVFLVNNQPFLVYGCGTRRVDPRKLAERLNVSRKKVKLANAEQVLDLTGYEVGTVPPLGLKTPMPTYMDPAIQQHEIVYAGGGGIDALLKIGSKELERASQAEIAPMLRDEQPESEDAGEDAD
jgi:uncharacterized protein (TIGR02118 family)